MSSRINSSPTVSVSNVTEFQNVGEDESPSSRSVRSVIANFETQQRQLELTSPKIEDRQSSGMTSSRVNVARLRAAHLRSTSEDFSRINLLNHQPVVSSDNTGGVPASSVAWNQMVGRSVADLQTVLQKSTRLSSEEGSPSSNEKPISRMRSRDIDVDLKGIEELEFSSKQAVDNAINGNNGLHSDSSNVCEVDCRSISVENDRTNVNKARQTSHKKPRPKVLPKPHVKRLPNGDVEIKKCARGCHSKHSDNQIIEGKPQIHAPDVCSLVCEIESHKRLSDNLELCTLDNSSLINCSRIKLTTSSSLVAVDALANELESRCSMDSFQVESAPVSCPDLVLVRRHSCRGPTSGDSSRTSSNLSVFGSSTNVDSIVDDELLASNSFYSSQADSGINIHESSNDSNFVEGTASPSGELQFDQVSVMLTASYGNCSIELSQIIFEWSTFRTALDYIGELYVETCEVQRYHAHLLSLCCHVSDSGVQYLSLAALVVCNSFFMVNSLLELF